MKKMLAAVALAMVMVVGSLASAAEASVDTSAASASEDGGAFNPFVVGAFMSMGAALTIGDVFFGYSPTPRFAGSGGAYFDFYLNDMLALEGGIGFIGKGYRAEDTADGVDYKYRLTFVDLEIPLGAKLNIKHFQASLAVALDFVVSGKYRAKTGNSSTTVRFEGGDWDDIRRFNLGPKIGLGYAIALGPVFLVPGLSWSMDLIDVLKSDDYSERGMNIMVVVAGEWGFGGEEAE
jgi:hypothetical protein